MVIGGNRVFETESTVGTAVPFTLLGAVAGYRTFAQEYANGATVFYARWDSSQFEAGRGTLNTATNQITPTVGDDSSSTPVGGAYVAPTWGVGTRNVIAAPSAQQLLYVCNDLAEVGATATGLLLLRAVSAAAARTALGLDDARVTLSSGQSGGTVGKFVRLSAANTWTDASQADTIAQLGLVVFKEASGLYIVSGRITLSGLTAGAEYFLSTAGGYVTPTPTASSTVRSRRLGVAINTTELMMFQSIAFGGS